MVKIILNAFALYSSPFTVIKSRSGENTITLDLDNEIIQVSCLANGEVKQGQLPLQVKAALYRGTVEITEFSEYRFLSGKEIRGYPVSGGGGLGDPLGAPAFPVPSAVVWSIAGKPAGISITLDGLIIVDTVSNLQNDYTIEAVYRGKTYTKTLKLTKALDGAAGTDGKDGEKGDTGDTGPRGEQGDPSPRYRAKPCPPPQQVTWLFSKPQARPLRSRPMSGTGLPMLGLMARGSRATVTGGTVHSG